MTDLVLAVFRLNGDLLSAGDRIAGEFGQSSARWQVMGAIDMDPQTVPSIARAMGLTRQSVQRTVDILETEGLVEYRDNPAHRRSKLVAMTKHGRKVYEAISVEQAQWVNQLAADSRIHLRDISRALNVLKALGASLEHQDELAERR